MMTHLYTIIEFLNTIVCIHFLYNKKLKLNIPIILLLLLNAVVFGLINTYHLSPAIILALHISIFLYTLIYMENNIKLAILSNMLTSIITGLLPLLAGLPWMFVITDFPDSDIIALIANASTLIILFLIRKFLGKLFHLLSKQNKLIYCSIALFFSLLIASVIYYKETMEISFEQLFLLIMFGSLIIFLSYSWQKERELLHIREMESHMHELYDASFHNLISSIKEKQHDFHNHLQTLKSLHYTIHSYEELVKEQDKYCSEILEDNKFYGLLNSGSPVLSGFLYGKFLDADKKQIHIDYFISILHRHFPVPEYILVEITGILWDNAVEYIAVNHDLEKCIYLQITETANELTIETGNPVHPLSYAEITDFFQYGNSKKKNHSGIGLNKILKYRDDYHFLLTVDKQNRKEGTWLFIKIIISLKPPHSDDGFTD